MNRRLFATIALSAVTSAAPTGIVVHTVRALDTAPSRSESTLGFRCVIPR